MRALSAKGLKSWTRLLGTGKGVFRENWLLACGDMALALRGDIGRDKYPLPESNSAVEGIIRNFPAFRSMKSLSVLTNLGFFLSCTGGLAVATTL